MATPIGNRLSPMSCPAAVMGFDGSTSRVRTSDQRGRRKGCVAGLRDTRDVPGRRNVGWPARREAKGNGAVVVLSARESRVQGEGRQVVHDDDDREGREMRETATVCAILRERGKHGQPLERVYRLLYLPDLYVQ